MKSVEMNDFNIGTRLTLTFAVLIALILGGNGLLVWQFREARLETERLTGGNQQVIAVLRLQESLLSFREQLDELVRSQDPQRVVSEAEPLRRSLVEQIKQTRNTLTRLPPETRINSGFLPILDAIETDLQSQIDAMTALATTGGWEAMRVREDKGTKLLESQISALVRSIDQESSEEVTNATESMRDVQRRILLMVPLTALSSFVIAAFFGWAVTRRIVELRTEERVSERLRLARQLHDTLLQTLHGVMFRFQAARNMLPHRTEQAMEALDGAIMRAEQAIAEGRDAITGLRLDSIARSDLAELLTTTVQELEASRDPNSDWPVFRLILEGERQTLSPIFHDEIYRIARELLLNAFRHACARRIEVEIRYDEREFRLRIRDDGNGIDPRVLKEGRRPGHWGLPGVRERAQRVGAQVDFWSEAGAGTEIQLTIPADIVYQKSSRDRGFQTETRSHEY